MVAGGPAIATGAASKDIALPVAPMATNRRNSRRLVRLGRFIFNVLLDYLTAEQNLRFHAELYGIPSSTVVGSTSGRNGLSVPESER